VVLSIGCQSYAGLFFSSADSVPYKTDLVEFTDVKIHLIKDTKQEGSSLFLK